MAYQTADILNLMQNEAATPLTSLRVDGGACANNLLLNFQADILGLPIIRPKCIETTALGAANLAGLATGVFNSLDEIANTWQTEKYFYPSITVDTRTSLLEGWQRAVSKTLGWTQK